MSLDVSFVYRADADEKTLWTQSCMGSVPRVGDLVALPDVERGWAVHLGDNYIVTDVVWVPSEGRAVCYFDGGDVADAREIANRRSHAAGKEGP